MHRNKSIMKKKEGDGMNQKERLMAMERKSLWSSLAYAKDWLAMDGVWFQAVKRRWGMDAAMDADVATGSSLP